MLLCYRIPPAICWFVFCDQKSCSSFHCGGQKLGKPWEVNCEWLWAFEQRALCQWLCQWCSSVQLKHNFFHLILLISLRLSWYINAVFCLLFVVLCRVYTGGGSGQSLYLETSLSPWPNSSFLARFHFSRGRFVFPFDLWSQNYKQLSWVQTYTFSGCLTDLTYWPINGLAGWLGWLTNWLTEWPAHWLNCWLGDSLTEWMND